MKQNSMYRVFAILCVIGFHSLIYSQNSSELPNLSPPTPNATSLHVYGNNQVKKYTGAADVQVPIFTIEQDGMSLPIYLQYTGGNGIKVSEIASWVGLGWTLNYGGAISRVKKGVADEEPSWGFLTLGDLPSQSDGVDPYIDICEGTRDGEPDNYSFNFPGSSGSFMFDLNGNINFKPLNNLRISYWIDNVSGEEPLATNPVSLYHSVLDGFKITNTDGIVYSFEEKEYSNSVLYGIPYSDNRGFPSSWYLSEITNYNQSSSILFEYDAYRYEVQTLSGAITNLGYTEEDRYLLTTFLAKRINRISFANGFVDFVAGTANRKDLNNERYLDKIVIRDKNENIIKQFQFSYQYATSSGFVNDSPSFSVSDANRLILKEIVELDPNGIQSKSPYVFSYYDSKNLPSRYSKSIDHWGYYNGQYNTKFEPEYYFRWFKLNEGWRTDLVGSANREAYPDFAKAGILESVQYPTGGNTTFNYEGNTVTNYDFLPAQGQKEGLINLSFQNSIQNIEIDQITTGPSPVELNFKSDTYTGTCLPKVFFRNTATNNTYSVTYGSMSPDILTTSLPLGNYDVWFQLLTGTGQPCSQEDPIILSVRYNTISSNPDYTGFVGGLRLASLTDSDSEGNNYTKRYEYLQEDDKTSSGVLVSNPVYGFVIDDFTHEPVAPSVTIRRAASEYPLLTTQGAYVGYSKITEISGDNGFDLGKTEYYYTTSKEFPDVIHKTDGEDGDFLDPWVYNGEGVTYLYPVPDMDRKDFLRGKLIKKNVYENQSGNLLLRKRIEHAYENAYYDYKDPFTMLQYQNRRVNTKLTNGIKIFSDDCNSGSYWSYYELHTGYSLLKETTTTTYSDSGDVIDYKKNNFIKDAEDFIDFYFPSSQQLSSSSGESLITTLKYPKDISNPSAAELNLLNTNRILPIEISNYKDKDADNIAETGELLETVNNNFGQFGNGVTELISSDVKKGNNSLESQVHYYSYDSSGNPLEVSKEDGAHIIYLWGYDDQFPIAKIENATSSEVSPFLGTLSAVDESDFPAINGLRMNLPNAMVTTYEYEPLIGITKITDPKGLETTYHYDTFNRLEFIKDDQGNLIEEYKYNYKN